MRFFSFNLELICTCEFSKSWNCTRRSGSCNFSFLKNSLVQINCKLNSKPYDYLYISDANGFQRPTLIFRFFNIKKMAANDRKRAMRNGQYGVFKARESANYTPSRVCMSSLSYRYTAISLRSIRTPAEASSTHNNLGPVIYLIDRL